MASVKNKLNRKLTKYTNILNKELNIRTSQEPGGKLMVCNVGVDSGINSNEIVKFFTQFGKIKSAVFVPKKSYSFVAFEDVSSAVECYEKVNGKLCLENTDRPIYLLYVEDIPVLDNDLYNFSQLPPGSSLIEDFIDVEEENEFIACAYEAIGTQSTILKQRQVFHFGYEFVYGLNNIDKNNPLPNGIPKFCDFIPERLNERGCKCENQPDQLTLNLYSPGQGIPPHIDTHSAFEDQILVLSLGSDCIMDFKKDAKHIPVVLKRRSMLVIAGESRYAWTHGIASRKTDIIHDNGSLVSSERGTRISFTFRKILKGECTCKFHDNCDSHISQALNSDDPVVLEEQYVHEVYENISDHFSRTRYKPWPKVLSFVQSFSPGSILLDVGCGNGKYFKLNPGTFEIGCDYSDGLTKICKDRGLEILRGDCLCLPFKDDFSDGVLCIAVLHHLSTPERRIQAVCEILRVLKPGGRALLYVWAKEQQLDESPSNYIKKDKDIVASTSHLKISTQDSLQIHTNRTDFTQQQQDILVPWKLQTPQIVSSTFLRFYHVFKKDELQEICQQANSTLLDTYYDDGNWCVVLSKNGQ